MYNAENQFLFSHRVLYLNCKLGSSSIN